MRSATLIMAAVAGMCGAAGAQTYSVVDLGTAGGLVGAGFAVNALGHAVGVGTQADAHLRAIVSIDGVPTPVAPLAGDLECWGFGIDSAGTAVAVSFTLGGLVPHGVAVQNGVVVDLDHFAPRAISTNGLMAGFVTIADPAFGQVEHAATWQSGGSTDLGTLGGSHSYAAGINSFGQSVGWSWVAGDLAVRAALWQTGVARDLGTLGGTTSQAYAISNNRGVVGVADTMAGMPHAFFFVVDASGAVTFRQDLGTLGGPTSYAYGVNNAAEVVGTSGTRAFLWRGGVMRDLNTMIPPDTGWQLERAWAINDAGQIVGTGLFNGLPRGFLLEQACYANCDGSTGAPILNVNDFVCYEERFAAGDPWANCDGSSVEPVLNVNDFVCFQQAFAAGCR